MLAQLLLVPLYLRNWSASDYGVWLGLFALLGFLDLIALSYQVYVGNEFLKIVSVRRDFLPVAVASSFFAAVIVGLGELLVGFMFVGFGWHETLLGIENKELVHGVGIVLIVMLISSFLCGSIGGVAVRVASALGYFSRMAWWSVFSVLVLSLSSIIPVLMGYGIKEAGVCTGLGVILFNIPVFIDLNRIMRLSGVKWVRPDYVWVRESVIKSMVITATSCLGMLRQQGARLVLAPLTGAAHMALFVTIRTGANVALQGLSTITNPLLPDLISFLNKKDQERSEAAFAVIWLVLACILAPAVVVLQASAPFLFNMWTVGQLEFDPLLFVLLSSGVLVFALAQPAICVVQGNNLLRVQFSASLFSGLIAVIGMFVFVPIWGVRGAGVALLAAELAALVLYVRAASEWMLCNNLRWPYVFFARVSVSVLVSILAMLLIAILPALAWVIIAISIIIMCVIVRECWKALPAMVRIRGLGILSRFPIGRSVASMLAVRSE
jgi:O-antigen/teichoic acid export membrane protein